MKKLMFVAAAAAMLFAVGCTKESKFESYQREMCEVMGSSKDDAEKQIAKALEDFRKRSAEEQDKILKELKEGIENAKKMKESAKNMKSKLGL